MKEHKYRGKTEAGKWVYGDLVKTIHSETFIANITFMPAISIPSNQFTEVIPETVGMYYDTVDGIDIYQGDFIKVIIPYRDSEDHYGENIPGPTNTYTQKLEPCIKEKIGAVIFKNGVFASPALSGHDDFIWPLMEMIFEYDESNIKEYFQSESYEWEEDLEYILEEYKLRNVDELYAHLSKVEVVGNIHDNPELLP